MKCSDFLWARCKFDDMFPEFCNAQVTAEMATMLRQNNDYIVDDVTGKRMTIAEAESIMGRNYKKMMRAYKAGNKSLFALLAQNQQVSDEEWVRAEKEASENKPAE